MAENPFQGYAPRGAAAQMLQARQQQRQQSLVARTLNEEIEAQVGDASSVDVAKAMPSAYFNAARRLAAIGNATEAQQLYAAGMQALLTTSEHAANLAKTKAETGNLDEAPTEYLETMRQRDNFAAQAKNFAEDTPTGAALRKQVAELDERLEILNARGGSTAALPREIVLAADMTRQRRAADPSATPVTTEEVWNRERQTSQRAQDYAIHVERETAAGRKPVDYKDFTPDFQAQIAAGQEGGKRAVTRLDEDEQEAIAAVTTARSIGESLALINEGVRSGTAAGARQYVARAAATFLGEDPSQATVNTDAYIASSAPRLVQIVRALAPVTEQDKDYINAAIAGQLDIATPQAFRKMLEIAYRAAEPKVARYNTRLGVLGEEYSTIADDFKPIEMPKLDFAAPAAQRVRIRVDAQGRPVQ